MLDVAAEVVLHRFGVGCPSVCRARAIIRDWDESQRRRLALAGVPDVTGLDRRSCGCKVAEVVNAVTDEIEAAKAAKDNATRDASLEAGTRAASLRGVVEPPASAE